MELELGKDENKTEERIQQECILWLQKTIPTAFFHHSPNGGMRNKIEATKFKSIGTKAGFPDLLILLPNCKPLFVEMKTPKSYKSKNSGLSKAQKNIHKRLFDLGYQVSMCYSVKHFKILISGWQSICKTNV
jgi:hypothetical protein